MSAQATLNGLLIAHTGPAPYTARSASDRDPHWPHWYVADAVGFNGFYVPGLCPTFKLLSQGDAIAAAEALNATEEDCPDV